MNRLGRLRLGALLLAAGMALSLAGEAPAQTYPSGQIKMFSGFAAGGTVDIVARDIAAELERVWGQPVIVENRPGANGATATAALAKSKPDGLTLMVVVSGHITNSLLYQNLGFDPLKDVVPVSLIAASPLLVFAHPSFAPSDIKSLVALAKEKPGTLSYSTPGTGSIQHLSMELLSYLAQIKLIHVPYRGGAPALNDVLAGHVPLSVLSVFQALSLVQEKRLKPLAVTSSGRTDALPDVPSMAESGVPGYEAELWFGLIAPAGTPDDILAKLNAAVVRYIKTPETKARLAAQGARPIGSTPAEFAALLRSEQDKWSRLFKEANIKGE
jgi:tripartite-type tricarboxylate transporter receptor subunit TctC